MLLKSIRWRYLRRQEVKTTFHLDVPWCPRMHPPKGAFIGFWMQPEFLKALADDQSVYQSTQERLERNSCLLWCHSLHQSVCAVLLQVSHSSAASEIAYCTLMVNLVPVLLDQRFILRRSSPLLKLYTYFFWRCRGNINTSWYRLVFQEQLLSKSSLHWPSFTKKSSAFELI